MYFTDKEKSYEELLKWAKIELKNLTNLVAKNFLDSEIFFISSKNYMTMFHQPDINIYNYISKNPFYPNTYNLGMNILQ